MKYKERQERNQVLFKKELLFLLGAIKLQCLLTEEYETSREEDLLTR